MKIRPPAVAVLLAALTVPAMGAQPPAAPAQPAAPTQPAKSPPAAQSSPTVTLLEAGQAPRAALRYTPKADLSQNVALTMTMDQEQEVNGQAMPSRLTPPMKMSMTLRVVEAKEGGFKYTAVVTGCEALDREGVSPQIKQMAQQALEGMKGMEMTMTSTDRAIITDASLKMPEGLNPMLKQTMGGLEQSMKQFATPVPAEDVGVGARWEVNSVPTIMGMKTGLKMIYTLESLEGGVAKLKVEQVQTNEPGPVSFPGLPEGVTVEVTKGQTRSTGELTIDTARVLPVKGVVKGEGTTELSVDQAGQKIPMKTRTKVAMQVEG